MKKKVFVSGCYDMLHSGHVAFFEEAAALGDLYVGIGSDKTVYALKNRKTINTEEERLYMILSLKVVAGAWVNSGSGLMDFEEDVRRFRPDIFFVNEDGHTPLKETFCKKEGIEYIISRRIPKEGLPTRSTTALRKECRIPYRIDLAGGWLDQPFVSRLYPGPVITICIEPDYEFNDRSGMSTSTRKAAMTLWQTDIPAGDREQLARILFSYENPPGTENISGSQDSLGIVMPGLNRHYYNGGYWPIEIQPANDNDVCDWLEEHLCLMPLPPRETGYNAFRETNLTTDNARALSEAAEQCWQAALSKDIDTFASAFVASFEAQRALFPNTINCVQDVIDEYKQQAIGWKLCGAGGGGYLCFVLRHKDDMQGLRIRIRRE